MKLLKLISLIFLILLYTVAGINHFIHPDTYIRIIPGYLPYPHILNTLAGILELLFAVGLIFRPTRRLAAWGIVLMLIAFMPVHIKMLMDAPFKLGDLIVTPTLAWGRLLLQPLLIWWAWRVGSWKF